MADRDLERYSQHVIQQLEAENAALKAKLAEAEQKNIDWAKGNLARVRESVRSDLRLAEAIEIVREVCVLDSKPAEGSEYERAMHEVGIEIRDRIRALVSDVTKPRE